MSIFDILKKSSKK